MRPTPTTTDNFEIRMADFTSLSGALDYAAQSKGGLNFHNSRAELTHVLTYSDLRKNARNLAEHLLSHPNIYRGDRISIVAEMSPEFVTLFFACQYAGLLAVPLPAVSGLGSREGYEGQLTRIIETSNAKMAIGSEKVQGSLIKATSDLNIPLIGTIDDVKAIPNIGPDLHALNDDEQSHIQFSSGSTRKPLGIQISQKALMANARAVALDGLEFRPHDRVASWLPFYHDMGLIGFLIIPLCCQMSIDYLQTDGFARRPLGWLQIISDNRCTMAYSPSFGYELCTRRMKRQKDVNFDLSCWRVAGIGGEMVQPEILEEFSSIFSDHGFSAKAFVPSYGLAEMTLAFSFAPLDTGIQVDRVEKDSLLDHNLANHTFSEDNSRDFALCGIPLKDHELEIRDENGAVLPERQVGSVVISGPSLMSGYDLNEEETNRVLLVNGWLDTGDKGYMIDGNLVITGRSKDLLIINGRNIWPQDLEWQVEQEIDILNSRDTAAFAVTSDKGKDEAVILAHCRTHDENARQKLRKDIQAIIFRTSGIHCKVMLLAPGSLPFTTSGKLSRNQARQNYIKGRYTDIEMLDDKIASKNAASA